MPRVYLGEDRVTGAPNAEDVALAAWTCDTALGCGATTGPVVAGTIYLNAVWVRSPRQVARAYHSVGTAGSTLTAGQNLVGLYDATGARIAVSPSMDVAWTSTGLSTAVFTAPVTVNPGLHWIAVLTNGTTPPAFRMPTGGNLTATLAALNAGVSAAEMRCATNGTAQTVLPAALTPSSNVTTGALAIWGGLA